MNCGGRSRTPGLTLVEVLVALAVLGVVTASLVALQVGSLRATRTALLTRELAAAAQHQLVLARLLPTVVGCHGLDNWPTVETCQLTVKCLDAACELRSVSVHVESKAGRAQDWPTVAYDALEAAPKAESAPAAVPPAADGPASHGPLGALR